MDLSQGLALAGVAAILTVNLRMSYQLGQIAQGFTDLRRRVELLEGTKNELVSKAA